MSKLVTLETRPTSINTIVCTADVNIGLLSFDTEDLELRLTNKCVDILKESSVKAVGMLPSERGFDGGWAMSLWATIHMVWINITPFLKHLQLLRVLSIINSLGFRTIRTQINKGLDTKTPRIGIALSLLQDGEFTELDEENFGLRLFEAEFLSQYLARRLSALYPEYRIKRSIHFEHMKDGEILCSLAMYDLGIEKDDFEQLLRRTLVVQQPLPGVHVIFEKSKFGLLKRSIAVKNKSKVYYTLLSTKVICEPR